MSRHRLLSAAIASVLWFAAPLAMGQAPLGNAFTYQGSLQQDGAPANGVFPMVFTLWDADAGGNQIGPAIAFDGMGGNPAMVAVVDGVFNVALDFGADAFGADARWLETMIDGSTLAPRTRITPAPSSLFSAAPWTTAHNAISYVGGRVGIGTNTPNRLLDLRDPSDCELGLMSTSDGSPRQWTLQSSSGTASGSLAGSFQIIDRTAGVSRVLISGAGNVGIGSNNPIRLLTVGGSFYASGTSDLIGNVGIGTNATAFKLDVDGEANFRELVTMNGALRLSTPSNGVIFGAPGENSDPMFLWRYNTSTDRSTVNLVIGDNPAGGAGFDDFIISTTAVTQFQFTSDARAFKGGFPTWESFSDARMKHDIRPLDGSLARLLRLSGRTFYYNDPTALGARPGLCTGFIAQEVEPIFPEWVGTNPDGMKTMHITGFEALAVESLRELRAEKDAELAALRAEKDAQVAALELQNRELADRLARLEAIVGKPGSR